MADSDDLAARFKASSEASFTLAKEIILENADLNRANKDLLLEIQAWKANSRDMAQTLASNAAAVKQYDTSKFVVVLIDGAGYPFDTNFLQRGREGGHELAVLLREQIANAIASRSVDGAQILLFVYANQTGLGQKLAEIGRIPRSRVFDDFVKGFNASHVNWQMIDSGQGKEAADSKVKAALSLYGPMPQCKLILFGGVRDGGYAPCLANLRTDGHLGKIVWLACACFQSVRSHLLTAAHGMRSESLQLGNNACLFALQREDLFVSQFDNVFMADPIEHAKASHNALSWAETAAGVKPFVPASAVAICLGLQQTGQCAFGDSCRFSHNITDPNTNRNGDHQLNDAASPTPDYSFKPLLAAIKSSKYTDTPYSKSMIGALPKVQVSWKSQGFSGFKAFVEAAEREGLVRHSGDRIELAN